MLTRNKFPPMVAIGLCLALCHGATRAAAQDWPAWRGAGRDGVAHKISLPQPLPAELKQGWRVEVGEGHSSPVTLGDKVFIFARRDGAERLSCLELASGRVVWNEGYDAPYEVNSVAAGHGAGPKATPAVAAGKIFTLGINGQVTAFNAATGRQVWKREFSKDFKDRVTAPLYGSATSPLIHGEDCIVHVGGNNDGALIAFNVASGKSRWTLPLDGPGYTSPILLNLKTGPLLVSQGKTSVYAVDPVAGKKVWQQRFTTDYDQNSVTPVVAGTVLILGGVNRPTIGLSLPMASDAPAIDHPLWSNNDAAFYMSTPVVAGKKLYGFTHRNSGQLVTLDSQTGEITWRGAPRQGENASLALVGNYLLMLTEKSQLTVLDISGEEPTIAASYTVSESPTWAHVVPVRNGLLIKDQSSLTLWTWK